MATGKYIFFLDSDDWLEKDGLQQLYELAQDCGTDSAKLSELALIFQGYETLLAGTGMDPSDRLELAASRLEAALARGCKVTGATVHFVNEECDGGPILLQKAVDILPGDTPEVLQKRVMEQAEWKLLPKAVAMVCSGEIK